MLLFTVAKFEFTVVMNGDDCLDSPVKLVDVYTVFFKTETDETSSHI